MSTTITLTKTRHILIFPFPATGHMTPLLDLTHQLAPHFLTITILVSPKNLHLLTPLISAHPTTTIEPLVLPFPPHPKLPPGHENASELPVPEVFDFMMHASGELYQPLLQWFKSHPSPPEVILSDMFFGWTHRLACEVGIRRLVFSPSGGLAMSVIFSLWTDMPKRRVTDPADDEETVTFVDIPNCPKYPWWQVSPMYRRYVEGDPISEFVKEGFLDDVRSWGIVFNSFNELEMVYFDYLKKKLGHDRVWAVGPLHYPRQLNGGSTSKSTATSSATATSVHVDKIVKWLDNREEHKVIYICFGSQAVLTNHQMEAIATGLEKSGVDFIWSLKVKDDVESSGKIPDGFEDRTTGKGLVIKDWAPQVTILGHRAVGAFLTHCGWNSVLEGLVAGVPMLAWPLTADQFLDATLLVDHLKVGRRVGEGGERVPESDELARVFVESVSENRVERRKAMEISEAALKAVNGGSSVEQLRELIEEINHE